MAIQKRMTEAAKALIAELKAFLDLNGIKYSHAAKEMGFSRQQLGNWLSGYRLPGLDNYFKIRRYLDSKKGKP